MDYTPARRKPPIHNWKIVRDVVSYIIYFTLGKFCSYI
jgi:hypothetical protein